MAWCRLGGSRVLVCTACLNGGRQLRQPRGKPEHAASGHCMSPGVDALHLCGCGAHLSPLNASHPPPTPPSSTSSHPPRSTPPHLTSPRPCLRCSRRSAAATAAGTWAGCCPQAAGCTRPQRGPGRAAEAARAATYRPSPATSRSRTWRWTTCMAGWVARKGGQAPGCGGLQGCGVRHAEAASASAA